MDKLITTTMITMVILLFAVGGYTMYKINTTDFQAIIGDK